MVRDVLLSQHCVSVQWFCSAAISSKLMAVPLRQLQHHRSTAVARRGGTKIGDNVLLAREVKHLHIDLRNECQVVLLTRKNGGSDSRQGSHLRLVVLPKQERKTFTK